MMSPTHLAWTAATVAVAALIGAGPALAWGNEGHEVVALIAWTYLAAPTRSHVNEILATDGDGVGERGFASAATWADQFRRTDRRTAGWHYTDLEVGAPDFDRACDTPRSCAPDQVSKFARVLADRSAPPADRAFALKMVLHLVGDLHQPLHSATTRVDGRNDAGGNCERVTVSSTADLSLHQFWDDVAVSDLGRDAGQLARALRGATTRDEVRVWADGSPRDWTLQSYRVAVNVAYPYTSRPSCDGPPIPLPATYRDQADRAAAEQLKRAGVRLAVILNETLGQ